MTQRTLDASWQAMWPCPAAAAWQAHWPLQTPRGCVTAQPLGLQKLSFGLMPALALLTHLHGCSQWKVRNMVHRSGSQQETGGHSN